MADQKTMTQTDANPTSLPQPWTQNWQMPALLLGLVLFGAGVWMALPERPDQDLARDLTAVEQLMEARSFDKADERLQAMAEEMSQAPRAVHARYLLLRGDHLYLQQESRQLSVPEVHRAILKHYADAREAGLDLDQEHLRRQAMTLVALDREEEAMAVVRQIRGGEPAARYTVIRQLIEKRMAQPDPHAGHVVPLLVDFQDELQVEPDPARRRAQHLWATTVRGQLLLAAGEAEKALDFLNLRFARYVDQGGDRDLGAVMVTLAQAYQMAGRQGEARYWFEQARSRLAEDNPENAWVLVGLGQVELAEQGDVRKALESFTAAEALFPGSDACFEALVGRADCEARLGSDAQALEHLAQAAQYMLAHPRPRPAWLESITAVVRANHELHAARDAHDTALQYLNVMLPLTEKNLSAELLGDLAAAHERLGAMRKQEGDKAQDKAESGSAQAARKLAFQEAALHFSKAADYYLQQAEAVTVSDNELHGNALWRAAANRERAQQWEQAIHAYAQFIRTRPEDSRKHEAMNRLGLAYMAQEQFKVAADILQELVEQKSNAAVALSSLVPLARCRVVLGEFDQAQRVLEHVLGANPAITPDADPYREALIELGKLFYQRREYARAIEKLEEAVTRYGETPEGPGLRFRLADAYRQSLRTLDQSLQEPMPQSQRQDLLDERGRRLERALVLFSQVITAVEAAPQRELSSLEATFFRNAWFYRADCAYDLRRFEQAVDLYNLAAKRWEDHPAALVALVQMVNAYCEQGRTQEARAANDRARYQLKRIPDQAFDDPTLPMNREHWETWLRWSNELNLFASGTATRGTAVRE